MKILEEIEFGKIKVDREYFEFFKNKLDKGYVEKSELPILGVRAPIQ